MEHVDTIRLRNNVQIVVADARTLRVLDVLHAKNLVVTTGLGQIIDLAQGNNTTSFGYGAVGTSATAAAAAQTTLLGEVFRNLLTASTRSGAVWTITFILGSTQGNGSTIQEYAEFNASASGVMLARVVHASIAKTSAITISYTHTITLTAS